IVRLRGAARRQAVAAFVVAGLVFAVVWGPFMWQQRALFSLSDEGTFSLYEPTPDHLPQTLGRLALLPARLIAQPSRALLPGAALPDTARSDVVDPRVLAAQLKPMLGDRDLLMIAATAPYEWRTGAEYLLYARYLRPFPSPIVLLTQAAPPAVRRAMSDSRHV